MTVIPIKRWVFWAILGFPPLVDRSSRRHADLRICLARAAGVTVLPVARTGGASATDYESWTERNFTVEWLSWCGR